MCSQSHLLYVFQFMLALLDHDPDIFLDEIQDQLEDQHGVIISIATIWRILKQLGIMSKKVCCVCIHGEATLIPFDIQLSRAASEHCEAAHCKFTLQVGENQLNDLFVEMSLMRPL